MASSNNSLHLIKSGPGWVPADQYAEEWGAKYKDGDEIVVKREAVKNPKEVRWFFAMLRKVVENQTIYTNTEELRSALLIATGHYTWRRDLFSRRYEHPDSFTDMDDEVFKLFKRESLRLIQEQLGIDATELMREVDGTQKWVGPMPWQSNDR